MRNPDLTLDLEPARGPIVYAVYTAESECLYVGRSFVGLARPFFTRHHDVAGLGKNVAIWFCLSEGDCETLESQLIQELEPTLNVQCTNYQRQPDKHWVEKFNKAESERVNTHARLALNPSQFLKDHLPIELTKNVSAYLEKITELENSE